MVHNGRFQVRWDQVRGELRALATEEYPNGPFLEKEPTPGKYVPDLFHFVGHTCVGIKESIAYGEKLLREADL